MDIVRVVGEENAIYKIKLFTDSDLEEYRMSVIAETVFQYMDELTKFIPLSLEELTQVSNLGKELLTKICYNYLILNGNIDNFLKEIHTSRYYFYNMDDLSDICYDPPMIRLLKEKYSAFVMITAYENQQEGIY